MAKGGRQIFLNHWTLIILPVFLFTVELWQNPSGHFINRWEEISQLEVKVMDVKMIVLLH